MVAAILLLTAMIRDCLPQSCFYRTFLLRQATKVSMPLRPKEDFKTFQVGGQFASRSTDSSTHTPGLPSGVFVVVLATSLPLVLDMSLTGHRDGECVQTVQTGGRAQEDKKGNKSQNLGGADDSPWCHHEQASIKPKGEDPCSQHHHHGVKQAKLCSKMGSD
jgi:hypothetical protein